VLDEFVSFAGVEIAAGLADAAKLFRHAAFGFGRV